MSQKKLQHHSYLSSGILFPSNTIVVCASIIYVSEHYMYPIMMNQFSLQCRMKYNHDRLLSWKYRNSISQTIRLQPPTDLSLASEMFNILFFKTILITEFPRDSVSHKSACASSSTEITVSWSHYFVQNERTRMILISAKEIKLLGQNILLSTNCLSLV